MRKMPIVTAFILMTAGAAQAETPSSQFQSLDADANGYLSQQEAASNADLSKRWEVLDANKDNQLDTSEFSAFEINPRETEMMDQTAPAPTAPTAPRY